MPEKALVVAYVRVSSASQGHAMQRDAIERVASDRGDKIDRWYSDTKSGATMQRSDLDELRRSVREGLVAKIYVFRLDRLTRSGIRDTLGLVEEFHRVGCKLVTIADGFDLGGPAAEIVLAVMAWGAKLERLAIAERIAAARVRLEAKGGAWGRPTRMLTSEVDRAIVLASKGKSLRAIAMALKIPKATISRALARASQKSPPKPFRPGPVKAGKKKDKRGSVR